MPRGIKCKNVSEDRDRKDYLISGIFHEVIFLPGGCKLISPYKKPFFVYLLIPVCSFGGDAPFNSGNFPEQPDAASY